MRDDFLSLANVHELTDQAKKLKAASDAIADDADEVDAFASIRGHAPKLAPSANPWEMGYRFAAELRQALNGGNWKSSSLDQLAGILNLDQLDHCLLRNPSDCRFLDAITGSNRQNAPKFIIDKQRPDSIQFTFLRAMFEHLTLPPGRFAAVSRLRTERQRMNRAFAAEFLAPHAMLKKDLSGQSVAEDEIEEIAPEYGVSPYVIEHQIRNHRLAWISN